MILSDLHIDVYRSYLQDQADGQEQQQHVEAPPRKHLAIGFKLEGVADACDHAFAARARKACRQRGTQEGGSSDH